MSSQSVAATSDVRESDRRRWVILSVLVVAQFMVVLDVAIVNVALPTIKNDLHFSEDGLQWVITAYAIVFGGVLLLGGRMADLLGRRRVFMAGMAVFTIFSLLDGLAWSSGSLIAFRGLQGLGAALLAPAALSILTTTFREGRDRNVALGIWGAASGSGGAAGVLLGGALTSAFSWSWIFFINVPVGVLVLALSPLLLTESRADLDHRHFDTAGAASITGGLMLARLRAHAREPARLGHDRDGRTPRRLGRADRRVPRDRDALSGAVAAAPHLPPADADGLEHHRPADGSGDLLPVLPAHAVHAAGAALLGAEDGSRLHRADALDHRLLGRLAGACHPGRHPARPARGHGPLGRRPRAVRATAGARDYFANLFPAFILSGIGLAFAFVPMSIGALTGVKPADAGVASGLLNTNQQIGGAIGVALATTIATTYTSHYVIGHPGVAPLDGAALNHGFQIAFYVLAALAAIAAVISAIMIEPGAAAATVPNESVGDLTPALEEAA
jgi:Arabinose efflux permease